MRTDLDYNRGGVGSVITCMLAGGNSISLIHVLNGVPRDTAVETTSDSTSVSLVTTTSC